MSLDMVEGEGNLVELSLSHSRRIAFKKVSMEHLTFLEKGCIVFLVYVDQEDSRVSNKLVGDFSSPF